MSCRDFEEATWLRPGIVVGEKDVMMLFFEMASIVVPATFMTIRGTDGKG